MPVGGSAILGKCQLGNVAVEGRASLGTCRTSRAQIYSKSKKISYLYLIYMSTSHRMIFYLYIQKIYLRSFKAEKELNFDRKQN